VLADILDEAVHQLEEAQWLIDLREAVSQRPRDAREAVLHAVREGRALREGQRARVIAALHARADSFWAHDLELVLDQRATEITRNVRHRLSKRLLGDRSPAVAHDGLHQWCADQVSCGLAVAFERAVASARAFAVGLVEEGQRECRARVANPDEALRQLFADGPAPSSAPDPWQPLSAVQIPEVDDLSVPIGRRLPGRAWGNLSFVARLPGFIGRLGLVARLRRDVAITAAAAASALAGRLRQQLHACIQRVDLASVAALDLSRRRVETVLSGDTTSRQLTASAVRGEWTLLLARLRRAQALLLEDMSISEILRPENAADNGEGAGDAEPGPGQALVPDPSACPVCAAAGNAVFSFLCRHHRITSAEGERHREFLRAGGLCPSHTWQLEVISAPRGLSVTYPPLLESLAERLRSFLTRPRSLPVTDSSACAACRTRRSTEEETTSALVAALGADGRGCEDVLQTCQFHLSAILARLPPARGAEVLAATADRLASLADDMREYALKLDALRGSLVTPEESQAYLRALAFLAGEKRVF
jgi:hypothetical protein